MRIDYEKNKPIINSVIAGLSYFLFTLSIEWSEGMKGLFIVVMFFLPAVTFPMTTSYSSKISSEFKLAHLLLSIVIYFGSVWLFSGHGIIRFLASVGGFSGSVLYLLISKFILKKEISLISMLMTAILSGLAFLPCDLFRDKWLGISLLLWTVVNGCLMNQVYRKELNFT